MIFLTQLMKKCVACGSYSMKEKCGCGGATRVAHPPRFSFADKYAAYRRKEKFGSEVVSK